MGFNSQKRGRLNLIRHLLDHLPDVDAPETKIAFPPLKGRPSVERYRRPVKPIRGKY